jgi:myo-inositol-hexaphosphate 3-phosphohydrolase
VDTTESGGHLTADVEGLTIYDAGKGAGYLIASSQGSDSFVIYRREGANAYVATFQIVAANGIDAVSGTDGIDVTSANLGPAFPRGMFIAQDGKNDGCNQNFKIVPWHTIAAGLGQASSIGPATGRHTPPANTKVAMAFTAHRSGAGTTAPTATKQAFLPIVIGRGC